MGNGIQEHEALRGGARAGAARAMSPSEWASLDAWPISEASADEVKAMADRMGLRVDMWPVVGHRSVSEYEAHAKKRIRENERANRLHTEWIKEKDRNGKSPRAAELFAEICRKRRPRSLALHAISEKVAQAERDPSRRGELFAAIRGILKGAIGPHCVEAERVVRMATVLLDAGRSMSTREESDREHDRWGEWPSEETLYAARYAGVVKRDMYGVLSLVRPVDMEAPVGWDWMYEAMEKAARLGVARYTDAGIELSAGAGTALTPRELAGAEAVAAGVNAYGEPPGLGRWLKENARGGRAMTWAEATVDSCGAEAEVGEAYERLVAQGRAPPADPREAAA